MNVARSLFHIVLPLSLAACGNELGLGNPFAPAPKSSPAAPVSVAPSPPSSPPPSTPAVATPAVAAADSTTCGIANFQSELIARVNQARASGRVCGGISYPAVAAVSWNEQLKNAATEHSADMARRNYFGHTGSDGTNGGQRINRAGYQWRMWAENITAVPVSVEHAMALWFDSPPHCAAIMHPAAVEVGASCVQNNNAQYKNYWTMELAAPR